MSRISKIMSLSSTSLSAVRGGYRSAMASNITHLSIIRLYLKIFVYLLIVVFALLQYINWENSTTIVHHDTNMRSVIIKQSHQQRQQKRQQQLPVVEQQQERAVEQQQQQSPGITTKIHIVFSTGCNAYQDWQSYLFFYQIWQSGQTGNITRVASGCKNPNEEQLLKDVFQKEIQEGIPTGRDRFHLHITPDYSTLLVPGKTYKFFNKPCGLLHWMEHALNMPHSLDKEYSDTMFIILDPDQFILRPFTSNDFYRNMVVDDAKRRMYWHTPLRRENKVSSKNIDPKDFVVREGYPMAQLYMFGSRFMDRANKGRDGIIAAANTMMYNNSAFQEIVSDTTWKSNLYKWTHADVDDYYAAGPPYIAMGRDMYRIVAVWAAIVVPVYHACDGDFLSEMYAYTTAAAHLNVPHLLGYNLMISETEISLQEGWNDIDTIPNEQICYRTQNNSTDTATVQWHDQYYPHVVHYCQRYFLGPYFFNKYRLPHNFLTCAHPLYLDPTTVTNVSIVDLYDSATTPDRTVYSNIPMQRRKRLAIMLCIVIGGLNDAATYWKQQNCEDGKYEKVYFVPPDPEKKPRKGKA